MNAKGVEHMESFDELLACHRISAERYVRFRIASKADADDILQEVYLTAFHRFDQLKSPDAFKAWLISIARSKCSDYFRERAVQWEIPIENVAEKDLVDSRHGITAGWIVRETLGMLGDKDKQILFLYFWKNLPQAEIAQLLNVPLGTVKSRLHTAKQKFKKLYPCTSALSKGENTMKKLPAILPEYQIEPLQEPPFSVKWEELMGWFLIPKLGEKVSWGMYDLPSRKCSHVYDMKVTGKAVVHGIEGVELIAKETPCSDKKKILNRTFVAQLTDTHCRYLATVRDDGDVRNYITFLDGDDFMLNWGYGEDNCGNETNLSPKGEIRRTGSIVESIQKDFLLDIVGRYYVTIGGKTYDTVCVMDIEDSGCGVISEQFLDKNGRTILWRRFNRNDWAIDRYKQPWTELLPDNERITVNGTTYVHWYDCITDYIL